MSAFEDGDASFDAVYAEEAAMVDASELLADLLEKSNMTRADLSRALDVSRGEITERLRGERNITIRKLAATVHALGYQLEISAASRAARTTRDPYAGWFSKIERRQTDLSAASHDVAYGLRMKAARLRQIERAS